MPTYYTPIANGEPADAATWNTRLDDLDAALAARATGATAITPTISGGAIDNTPIGATTPALAVFNELNVSKAAAAVLMRVSGDAGQGRGLTLETGGVRRWLIYCTSEPETGADAGSNFNFFRYTDAGTSLGSALTILRATGGVLIPGALSKGSGTFRIDHPLDPDNRILYHGFVEAPRYDLIYRGRAQLVAGRADVSIDAASNMTPGTWAALCKNAQVFVQNNQGWTAVRGRVDEATGILTIEAQDAACTDTVDWLVVAERDDPWIYEDDTTKGTGALVPEHDKDTPGRIHRQAAGIKQAVKERQVRDAAVG